MQYVIMKIKYQDYAEIESITEEFYQENEKYIVGMTTQHLKDKKTFDSFEGMVKEWENK